LIDEGGHGYGVFLSEFGVSEMPSGGTATLEGIIPLGPDIHRQPVLFRLSNSAGKLTLKKVPGPISRSSLSSDDVFLLDDSKAAAHAEAVYVWIGKKASLNERHLAIQYAQQYLYGKREENERVKVSVNIVKMGEGTESAEFLEALGS
jgi:gelsolin